MEIKKCPQCDETNNFLHFLFGHKYNKEVGFGWGKFYIFLSFILGIFAFLGSLMMTLLIITSPNSPALTSVDAIKYVLLIFILPAIFIIPAIGLLERKKWGLSLFYAINIIGLIMMLFSINKEVTVLELIISLIITYLWFRYFYKRKDFFN